MEFIQENLDLILKIVSPILLALLSWGSVKLTQLIKNKVKDEETKQVLLKLNDALFTAVKDVQQTIVSDLKAANVDGKLTGEEIQDVKSKAIEKAKSFLGSSISDMPGTLGMTQEEFEKYISSKLEAIVLDLKKE